MQVLVTPAHGSDNTGTGNACYWYDKLEPCWMPSSALQRHVPVNHKRACLRTGPNQCRLHHRSETSGTLESCSHVL